MARTVRNPKIDTRSARARLTTRREPFWTVISGGCALGYRRGKNGGTWIARFRDDAGRQHYFALGAADDAREADKLTVFSFSQAQEKARAFFLGKAREAAGDLPSTDGPLTVADAHGSTPAAYRRRGGKAQDRMESAIRIHILPELGSFPVVKLTRRRLEHWHERIASSPHAYEFSPVGFLFVLIAMVGTSLSFAASADSGTVRLSIFKAGWFVGGSGG